MRMTAILRKTIYLNIFVLCGTDPGPPQDKEVNLLAVADPGMFEGMPENLYDSLRLLDSSDYMKTSLGSDVINAFVMLKKKEWHSYAKHLTDWERQWYLNC